MAAVSTQIKKTAQTASERRAKRNQDWAEVGWSDKVAPRRLSYDEVACKFTSKPSWSLLLAPDGLLVITDASKACGALYLWATTAVDTVQITL